MNSQECTCLTRAGINSMHHPTQLRHISVISCGCAYVAIACALHVTSGHSMLSSAPPHSLGLQVGGSGPQALCQMPLSSEPFISLPPQFLRQSVSLNLELAVSTNPDWPGSPGIFLSSPLSLPQHWDCRLVRGCWDSEPGFVAVQPMPCWDAPPGPGLLCRLPCGMGS